MGADQSLPVQLLFIKSAEDEAVIAFPLPDAILEFHVQQAIEKLLKALIAAHGVSYQRTHDLQLLINQLASLGELLPDFGMPLQTFSRFGVTSRYDIGVPLNEFERQKYRKIVAEVRAYITLRVSSLS